MPYVMLLQNVRIMLALIAQTRYSRCVACILMLIKGTMFCSYTIYVVIKWKNYALYCDLCLLFLLVYRLAEQRNTDKGQFISICPQYMLQLGLLF